MKTNRKLSIAAIAMSAVLVAALAGCSGGGNAKETASAGPESSQPASASGQSPSANKTVQVTYHRGGTADTSPDPKNETNKYILQTFKDQFGVDLKYEAYDFGQNFMQRLNQFAASKKMPSGIWIFGRNPETTRVLNDMGRAGMFWDLTEYVNNSNTMKENAEDVFLKMNANPDDGKLYVFPAERHRSFPHAPGGIAIRKDWVEQSGLGFPQSEDDLYNLIKYIHENIKSDAGKPVIPVALNTLENGQGPNSYAWFNHWMGTQEWKEFGDRYEKNRYSDMEGLKSAILFLNRLWNEGLMDKESFTIKNDQFIQRASNGSIGVAPYTFALYSANDSLDKQYPNSDKYWVSVPPFAAGSSITADDVNSFELISQAFSDIVITKDVPEEDLQQIIAMIDWIGSYEGSLLTLFGIEGTDWKRDADNKVAKTEAYAQHESNNINYQAQAGLATYSALNPNPQALQDLLNAIVTRKAELESVANIKGHQRGLSRAIDIVEPGPAELKSMGDIEKAWQSMVIDAVKASSPDKAAAIVDKWPQDRDKMGYQAILDERNAAAKAIEAAM